MENKDSFELENLKSFSNLVIKNIKDNELSIEEYNRLRKEILEKIKLDLTEQKICFRKNIINLEIIFSI